MNNSERARIPIEPKPIRYQHKLIEELEGRCGIKGVKLIPQKRYTRGWDIEKMQAGR